MKYLIILLLVMNAGAVFVYSQKKLKQPPPPLIYKAPDKTELKEFTAEDKSFKITFPGVPKTDKRDMDKAIVTIASVYRQGSNSVISIYEFKNDLEDMKETAFALYKSSLEKSPKTKIEAERDLRFDGIQAKELDVLEDLKFQKIRLVISGKRLYELKNDVTNWHIISKYNKEKVSEFEVETNRFFGSFKLLDVVKKNNAIPLDFLGISNETTYVNNYFGFALEFPEGWYNSDPLEIEDRKNAGIEALKTNREKTDRAFADAANKEVIIFAVSKKKLEEGGSENFLVGVMKLPENETDANALLISSKNFFLTNPKIKLLEDVKNIEKNGVKYATVSFVTTIGDQQIYQTLFITIRKGYSVGFTFSYLDESGLKSLEKIFETVKFNLK